MKNVIITGANSGLGFETAKKIAMTSNEYRVILACRNMEKGETAKQTIISESGNKNITVHEFRYCFIGKCPCVCRELRKNGLWKNLCVAL